ncbi:MAG TPA: sirohydrochlorin chelatase [Streptosporangiaceae bacterium]|jgi:sirohydrochlorin cobaltochelatase
MTPPLLVVGHGTRDDAGVKGFGAFVDRLGARTPERASAGGFIELSPPPLTETVAGLRALGHTRLVAVPLMLVAAGHAKGDIPGALARERERHPGLRFVYGRPLGPHPLLLALLRERLATALGGADPGGTTVLLVGRGSTDPDANAEVTKVARLLWETSGTGGDRLAGVETAFVSLAAPNVPDGLARCRALGARRVVVLPYFLFPGVLPDRVADQTRAFAADHPEMDVRHANVIGDCDGLAEIVEDRYTEALSGDIRMNCDTCIYRAPMPGFTHRVGADQHPHHHPADPSHTH